jgi:prepilin-type processing-associated H-X9-DG protein
LPFIEAENVHELIRFDVDPLDALNAQPRAIRVSTFECPSDPQSSLPDGWAATSYRVNQGSGILWGLPPTDPSNQNYTMPAPNGVFFLNSSTRLADVRDGTSHTAAFSEHCKGDFNNGLATENDTFWPQTYPSTPDDAVQMCAAIDAQDLSKQRVSDVGAPWIQGYHSTTVYFHVGPPNSRSCMYPPGRIATTANSEHPQGVNVGFCDGSVHYVSNSVDLAVWRALGTRGGGEPIGDF